MYHTKSSLFDINLAYNSRQAVQTDGQPVISFVLPPPWRVDSPAPGLLRQSNNSDCDALCLQLWRHSDVSLPGSVSQPFFVLFIYRTCVFFPSNIRREESYVFWFISSFIRALIEILPCTPAVHILLVGNHCTRATRGLGVSANFHRGFHKVSNIILESERVETRGFSYFYGHVEPVEVQVMRSRLKWCHDAYYFVWKEDIHLMSACCNSSMRAGFDGMGVFVLGETHLNTWAHLNRQLSVHNKQTFYILSLCFATSFILCICTELRGSSGSVMFAVNAVTSS